MKPWRWRFDVFVVRHGAWPLLGAALLLLATVAWTVWLPARQDALLQARDALSRQRAQAAAVSAAPARPAPRLPAADQADALVRQLFTLAAEHGLSIAQADYRRQDSGAVGRWQVKVPATGSYPQVRHFVRATQALPGVSLDEISLQRDQTGAALEARMLFSIWYDAGGAPR